MTPEQLVLHLSHADATSSGPLPITLSSGRRLAVYPRSLAEYRGSYVCILRDGGVKQVGIIYPDSSDTIARRFIMSERPPAVLDGNARIAFADCSIENARTIRELFAWTRPRTLGTGNSFGYGDRLGIAGAGHVRAAMGSLFQPVFAQQSIRELERTGRTPEEVMAAAVWAVFQEGWRDGFGADADHLKTPGDITRMAAAGFTMYTIDPGDHVDHDADSQGLASLRELADSLPWNMLETTLADLMARYDGQGIQLHGGHTLAPDRTAILRAAVKYGRVIAHTLTMAQHLETVCAGREVEIELSVDETESPTTPFEHYLVAAELRRLGVTLASLAPRFIGDFEKGIDYRGDLNRFSDEYRRHLAVAEALGPYKLSLHSGSDKFSVYEAIGGIGGGTVHVKTAGTSYLVALQAAAAADPELFRDIYAFSREHYGEEKRSYHVSASLDRVPLHEDLDGGPYDELFGIDDVRQVLHVAFGRVLTAADEHGAPLFRDRLMACLDAHEEEHYRLLEAHFARHLAPFATGEKG